VLDDGHNDRPDDGSDDSLIGGLSESEGASRTPARAKRRTILGMAGTAVAGAAIYGVTDQLVRGSQADAAVPQLELTGGVEVLASGAESPQVSALTPFKDPLRIPPTLSPSGKNVTDISIVAKRVRLHSQLPSTPMWTFEGHFPGPTIEARSQQRIRIAWTNELTGTSPVKAVWAGPPGTTPTDPINEPGSKGTIGRPEIDALTPWTTIHLHGAHQFAIHDGMADGGVTPGYSQLTEYLNDNAATHLFYHDHAMPVTGINVFAGLIGNYIIRDSREDSLKLPRGKYEIPLMLSDVNFETDSKGRLTGELLNKRLLLGPYTKGVLPVAAHFVGPYTMVNGVVWPYLDVDARAYRFRLVNGAVGRDFALTLLDDATGKPIVGAMKVIGTDLGLLGTPKVVDGPLTLSPAERVDLIIDFAALAGKRLRLVNTFPGTTPGTAVPDGPPGAEMPFPNVMQFRVDKAKSTPYALPTTLASNFKQLTAAELPKNITERFVGLVFDGSGMPTLMELEEVPASTPSGKGIVQINLPTGKRAFRSVANFFEDTTSYFTSSGNWEKWTFINIDPLGRVITHPMHIHLMDFQLLERHTIDGSAFDLKLFGTSKPITVKETLPITAGESGWKDTVAVPVNTMVTIAGQYGRQTGRFMYHCHILDHEDGGMMRPLVIMPSSVSAVQNITMAAMGKPNSTATLTTGPADMGDMAGMDMGN
jgi:spore coat protein A